MPTISLSLGEKSYDVIVANGALDAAGEYIRRAGLNGAAALITDSHVGPLYAERVQKSLEAAGYRVSYHEFEAGEAHKNLTTIEQLVNGMVAAGHDRSSYIVALGGGVVGDMAGFTAAMYYRGIPFVQIPTSVMAQVDSSVGGKTAVDIAAGKNLIGAFHQPRLVIADPQTLTTLNARVLREGMAEMVKHAAIRDAAMLPALRALAASITDNGATLDLALMEELIAANVAIKARVVEEDEKETLGVRAFLNFGHTLGHGIEASVPLGSLLHGEVVSLGMRAALALSRKHSGLSADAEREVLDTLAALHLPLTLPAQVDPQTALAHTKTDKKFQGGSIRFVLLESLGSPVLSRAVTQEDLEEAMHHLTTPVLPLRQNM